MNRDRAAWLKDRTRCLVQGLVENVELVWQDWAKDLTDEETELCQAELDRLAKMIGKGRTFTSMERSSEED